MTELFPEDIGHTEALAQFHDALRAVTRGSIQRGQSKSLLCDQLLYVAACKMLELRDQEDDGTLEEWCDEMIAYSRLWYERSRGMVDRALEEQDAQKDALRWVSSKSRRK